MTLDLAEFAEAYLIPYPNMTDLYFFHCFISKHSLKSLEQIRKQREKISELKTNLIFFFY